MYRLVFEGLSDSSQTTKERVATALRSSCGLTMIELDSILKDGPTVITTSTEPKVLQLQQEVLTQAGGRALIIREKESSPRISNVEHIRTTQQKMCTLDELSAVCRSARAQNRRIVLCHGIFDLVHIGHIRLLNQAREYGDLLVVTVVADKHVNRGPGNPFFRDEQRCETLANLSVIDYVAIVQSDTAVPVIEKILPHVLIRGPKVGESGLDVSADIHSTEEAALEKIGGELKIVEAERFRTGQLTNQLFETYPHETTRYLKQFARKYSLGKIVEEIEKIKEMKVLVVGDTIIDQYHYCSPMGKSAKENIVVNRSLNEECYAGGIIATANHVAQLSDNTELLTVLGAQNSYEEFIRGKLDHGIKPHLFMRSNCVTTVKKRYVNKEQSAKLFEVCDLDDAPLTQEDEAMIAQFLNERLESYDLVVVNDFGHGMITRKLMQIICEKSKKLALNVQTNGANQGFNLVTNYQRADFVCIDERELRLATRERLGEVPSLMLNIAEALQCKEMVATRGSEGSMSFTVESGFSRTPAFATSSVDKIGAGDAFFAYTSPCFAAGLPQDLTAFIGNCVGALKVQIVGNKEQVKVGNLVRFIDHLLKL